MAVYAASIRSAGHAPSGVETNAELTLLPDHSVGADQRRNLIAHNVYRDRGRTVGNVLGSKVRWHAKTVTRPE